MPKNILKKIRYYLSGEEYKRTKRQPILQKVKKTTREGIAPTRSLEYEMSPKTRRLIGKTLTGVAMGMSTGGRGRKIGKVWKKGLPKTVPIFKERFKRIPVKKLKRTLDSITDEIMKYYKDWGVPPKP